MLAHPKHALAHALLAAVAAVLLRAAPALAATCPESSRPKAPCVSSARVDTLWRTLLIQGTNLGTTSTPPSVKLGSKALTTTSFTSSSILASLSESNIGTSTLLVTVSGVTSTGISVQVGTLAGPQGPAGPTGPTGPTGPRGPQGYSVSVSPTDLVTGCAQLSVVDEYGMPVPGATSATLCNGATGDRGPAGPQGPAGATGPQGAQGPVGPQGPAGPAGASGLPICPEGNLIMATASGYACRAICSGGSGTPGTTLIGTTSTAAIVLADTSTSTAHCGGCNRKCSGTCSAGVCQVTSPPPLSTCSADTDCVLGFTCACTDATCAAKACTGAVSASGSGSTCTANARVPLVRNGTPYVALNDRSSYDETGCISVSGSSLTVTSSVSSVNYFQMPSIAFGQVYVGDVGNPELPERVSRFVSGGMKLPFTWSFDLGGASGSYAAVLEIAVFPSATRTSGEQPIIIDLVGYATPGFWPQPSGVFTLENIYTTGPRNDLVFNLLAADKSIRAYGLDYPRGTTILYGDLSALLADAVRWNLIGDGYYVHSIRAGFEILSGGQGLTVKDFGVSVRAR